MSETNTRPITRLAIPVTANHGLLSPVSEHFGHAPGFLIVNSDGTDLDHIGPERRLEHECAPISALVQSGARVIIAHGMGRGALVRCHEAGFVILHAGDCRTVSEVLTAFHDADCADFPDKALCAHHAGHGEGHDCGHHHD